jgi:hypothetical protein
MRREDRAIFEKLNDLECLALTIYGEARGESHEGQCAVAFVIINRSRKWHKTIREVCYQKNQFSCYNSNDVQYEKLKVMAINFDQFLAVNEKLRKAYDVAFMCMNGPNESIVDDALYYRVINYKNKWFDTSIREGKLIKVCEIQNHEFFKEAI